MINIGLLAALFHDFREDVNSEVLTVTEDEKGIGVMLKGWKSIQQPFRLSFSTKEEAQLFIDMIDGLTEPSFKEDDLTTRSKKQFTHLLKKAKEIVRKYSQYGQDAAIIMLLIKEADRRDNMNTDIVLKEDGKYYLRDWQKRREKLIEGLIWFRLMVRQINQYFKNNSRKNVIGDPRRRFNLDFPFPFFTVSSDEVLLNIVSQLLGLRPEAIFRWVHQIAQYYKETQDYLIIPAVLHRSVLIL